MRQENSTPSFTPRVVVPTARGLLCVRGRPLSPRAVVPTARGLASSRAVCWSAPRQELFSLLATELCVQWAKAFPAAHPRDRAAPPSARLVRRWDWRTHSMRVAVLYALSRAPPPRHSRAAAVWPEIQARAVFLLLTPA